MKSSQSNNHFPRHHNYSRTSVFFGNRGRELTQMQTSDWSDVFTCCSTATISQWLRTHNHPLHNLHVFPASLKGVASIKWLTCLPPFFGLCWAPLLCPAPLQALLAPLVPSGALGPVAHSQPCSHLKGEARQFD